MRRLTAPHLVTVPTTLGKGLGQLSYNIASGVGTTTGETGITLVLSPATVGFFRSPQYYPS
jgi:hypothetical protein